MRDRYTEIFIGFIVLVIAIIFSFYAYNKVNFFDKSKNYYHLKAKFNNVDGMQSGVDVFISGIKIGHVADVMLDVNTFDAVVDIAIGEKFKLPNDSRATISSSGFFGNKYISIEPGASTTAFINGEEFKFTTPALSMDSIINKIVYFMTSKKSEE